MFNFSDICERNAVVIRCDTKEKARILVNLLGADENLVPIKDIVVEYLIEFGKISEVATSIKIPWLNLFFPIIDFDDVEEFRKAFLDSTKTEKNESVNLEDVEAKEFSAADVLKTVGEICKANKCKYHKECRQNCYFKNVVSPEMLKIGVTCLDVVTSNPEAVAELCKKWKEAKDIEEKLIAEGDVLQDQDGLLYIVSDLLLNEDKTALVNKNGKFLLIDNKDLLENYKKTGKRMNFKEFFLLDIA